MLQEVNQTLTSNKYIKAHSIEEAREIPIVGHTVVANISYKTLNGLTLLNKTTANPLATVTGAQYFAFFNFVEKSYTSYTYRNVKTNPQWCAVYNVEDNVMHKYFDRQHGLMFKPESVVACRKCGIILPLKVMTVDHQAPQTGGEIHAICRVFRGLGLTKARPKGAKNISSVQASAASVGGSLLPPGNPNTRYSFNNAGIIYYSIIREAKQYEQLVTHCLQHMLNLRPVCGPCNSRLGNSGAF